MGVRTSCLYLFLRNQERRVFCRERSVFVFVVRSSGQTGVSFIRGEGRCVLCRELSVPVFWC